MDQLTIPPFSRIISGAMSWGVWGKNLSVSDMAGKISSFIEAGVSTFDHADIYGGYTTEEVFGKALKESKINRGSIQLISKCGIQYPCEKRDLNLKYYDVSAGYIKTSVEQSLKNLEVDYLDILLIHRPSPLLDPVEVAAVVDELKQSGKILRFGVSNFNSSQLSLLLSKTEVGANQIEFSLTSFSALNSGILEYHKLCGIQTMAWAPLGSVFKIKNEQTERIIRLLNLLSEKYDASADELLISWLLKHPAHIYPVVGTTDLSRIKLYQKALHLELDTEDWFQMLVASQGHKVP